MPDQLPELVTLVLPRESANAQLAQTAIALLERGVLPAYLPKQRWFAHKDAALGDVRLVDFLSLGGRAIESYVTIVEVGPSRLRYFVPLALVMLLGDRNALPRATLARVRRGARSGFLYDALVTDALPIAILDDVRAERRRPTLGDGAFVAHRAPALATLDVAAEPAVRRLNVEQSNTSIVLGEAVMLKAYRRVHAGPQPELEIARFLDAVGYANTPALLGYLEYEHPGDEPTALCILQRFVESQGDGWSATLAYLERFFDRRKNMDAQPAGPSEVGAPVDDEHALFLERARTLGRRTAELHRAFATSTGDPAFEPEPATEADLAAWIEQAQTTARRALDALERGSGRIPAELRAPAQALLARRAEIVKLMALPDFATAGVLKTRYHGDFHLGQVLVVADDFTIVDFEGEPGREPEIRRQKSSPLRDVAGMLRSINYAAMAGVRGVTAARAEDLTGLEPAARNWERRSAAAFLDGYRASIAGCPSYPSDPDRAQRLLDLFVLEKAFYEMSYELANRPSWLRIPLEGIRAIVDGRTHALAGR